MKDTDYPDLDSFNFTKTTVIMVTQTKLRNHREKRPEEVSIDELIDKLILTERGRPLKNKIENEQEPVINKAIHLEVHENEIDFANDVKKLTKEYG